MPDSDLEKIQGVEIPNTESPSTLPKKERVSLRRMAEWFHREYQNGLVLRAHRDAAWIKVHLIMRGFHYFIVRNGTWRPVERRPNEVRAVAPYMVPRYRRELGRVGNNLVGVTVLPRVAEGKNAFNLKDHAQLLLDDWIREETVDETEDLANQHLLFYGSQAYHWYTDKFNRSVRLISIPGPSLFPIPHNAKTLKEADGVMYVRFVSRAWLEQQDDMIQKQTGDRLPGGRRMQDESGGITQGLYVGRTTIASPGGLANQDGALAIHIWMKRSESRPFGEQIFMINNRIYRYHGQPDEQNGPPLPGGKIPLVFTHYMKSPDDWWGYGFNEQLISMQLEANRQLSILVANARYNKPVIFYDPKAIDPKNVQDFDDSFIPLTDNFHADVGSTPIFHFPAPRINPAVGALLGIVDEYGDKAAGHDSPVTQGQAAGRVDSAAAIQQLNANAQVPLEPVFKAKWRAYNQIYPAVLDLLRKVWPEEKIIHTAGGSANLGRTITITRDKFPWSADVDIRPRPFMLNGRGQMLSLLFQLKGMPRDDGKIGLITDLELRRGLAMMEIDPIGLDMVNEEEQRILHHIAQLINDGQTPGAAVSGSPGLEHAQMENHTLAVQLLRKAILDPGFVAYGPAVKTVLTDEIKYHMDMLNPVPPNNFDDLSRQFDSRATEAYFDGMEQDVYETAGIADIAGVPIGEELDES